MTDAESFLAAIAANPDDDTVRLAYADFLEEHGDALRAEFIRLQIAIARTPANVPELAAMKSRAFTILEEAKRPGGFVAAENAKIRKGQGIMWSRGFPIGVIRV